MEHADPPVGHDLVAHLYAVALQLMQRHGQVFLPLEAVRKELGWSADVLSEVVDHCVATSPVALEHVGGGLVADWIDDGDRPAFGRSGVRMVGIRPAAA